MRRPYGKDKVLLVENGELRPQLADSRVHLPVLRSEQTRGETQRGTTREGGKQVIDVAGGVLFWCRRNGKTEKKRDVFSLPRRLFSRCLLLAFRCFCCSFVVFFSSNSIPKDRKQANKQADSKRHVVFFVFFVVVVVVAVVAEKVCAGSDGRARNRDGASRETS